MKQLTYGMVGGGAGAMIGQAHRRAIQLDNQAELTAGCFSSTAEKSKRFGEELGLESERCYANFQEMASAEGARNEGIDFVLNIARAFPFRQQNKSFQLQVFFE